MKASAIVAAGLLAASAAAACGAEAAKVIQEARITGGLVAQVGSPDLALSDLGQHFDVRLLLPDLAAVEKAQAAINQARLQGRFTVSVCDGKALPFADRVLNALVVAKGSSVSEAEARRVLAPGGLLIRPDGAKSMPWPETIDSWTHYLYNASGNAVSKDKEVGPPKSFRWWAPPMHLRSHNYGASFTGLVTDRGRLFYFLDEGTYLFDSGGATERWSLVARDAFNGALLWKAPLHGYGQPFFEDVSGQAVPDYIWRSPLSLNRRLVVQGDKLYAALDYRQGPLSVLDAVTGRKIHAVEVGGIVDEIVAQGSAIVCRVRTEIPMPEEELRRLQRWTLEQKLVREEGLSQEEVRAELDGRMLDKLMKQPLERVVAVDAAAGSVRWKHDAPLVGAQSLAVRDGKVVFHNYRELIALDAVTGQLAWKYSNPVVKRRGIGVRNLLGNLLLAEGKVLWGSSACGGGVCLNLADGAEIWKNPKMGTTGGFAAPTGLRVIRGTIMNDYMHWSGLSDGQRRPPADIGDMLKRGHHVRCLAGKATQRFLILPHRGAEYVDLLGDEHMPCDWIRGACSYGLMPANGLTYVTPDPCSCYAGVRILGLMALAAGAPAGLDRAPAAADPSRLSTGPAYEECRQSLFSDRAAAWPIFRADARRTGRAAAPLSAELRSAWSRAFQGPLTQATIGSGHAYVVDKSTYELHCLDLADGKTVWSRSFPAALDGPPTLVGPMLYLGCRDGHVYCLRGSDGAPAWRLLAAPQERLALSDSRIEGLWPVSSSVLFHNGLLYAVAGRNSYLDGGIHLFAIDPASGAVKHHRILSGPWPDKESMRKAVVTESELRRAGSDTANRDQIQKAINAQYATGYHMHGALADLLVTDGADLYMQQNKFSPSLEPVPLQRIWHTGLTPMGGKHMLANYGFLDDTMMHRSYMMFDDIWPGYGGGSGWAARAGTMLVVGEHRAYAAKHYTGGWYPTHKPGDGNRIVADTFDHSNTSGALVDKGLLKKFAQYGNDSEIVRTAAPVWEIKTPLIIRAMLAAPDGKGGELVFAAGVVEGKTRAEWDKSTYYIGPGTLLVHNGADGKPLAEYDLPACPVFDGMSAAEGKVLISLVNGQIVCLKTQ